MKPASICTLFLNLFIIFFSLILKLSSTFQIQCICDFKSTRIMECLNDYSKAPIKKSHQHRWTYFTKSFHQENCQIDLKMYCEEFGDNLNEMNIVGMNILNSTDDFVCFRHVRHLTLSDIGAIEIIRVDRLVNLNDLDLSFNKITALRNPSKIPPNIEELILNNNKINYIVKFYFKWFFRLKLLNLEFNRIKNLHLEFFFASDSANLSFSNNIELNNGHIELSVNSNVSTIVQATLNNVYWDNFPRIKAINCHMILLASYIDVRSFPIEFEKKINLTRLKMKSDYTMLKSISQSRFLQLNLEPFELDLANNDFKHLPETFLLQNLRSLNLSRNVLSVLDNSKYLSKWTEQLDFSFNRVKYLSDDFFAYFVNLQAVYLNGNILKSINKLQFSTTKISIVWFQSNNIEFINEIWFNSAEPLIMKEINFNDNSFKKFPLIYANLSSLGIFSMANQRSNEFLNKKSINLFKTIKLNFTLNNLNLGNNSIEILKCAFHNHLEAPYVKNIDLSLNKLDLDSLCSMFYRLDGSTNRKLNLKFFPQYDTNCDMPPAHCAGIKHVLFSFNSHSIEFEECKLQTFIDSSYPSYCVRPGKKRAEICNEQLETTPNFDHSTHIDKNQTLGQKIYQTLAKNIFLICIIVFFLVLIVLLFLYN